MVETPKEKILFGRHLKIEDNGTRILKKRGGMLLLDAFGCAQGHMAGILTIIRSRKLLDWLRKIAYKKVLCSKVLVETK